MILKTNSCWKLAVTLIYLSSAVRGAIQCYCNRDECKDTHTCISHTEKCYSKLYTVYAHENQTSQDRKDEHGCIDLVRSESRDSTLCDSSGDVIKQLEELQPLIMCCSDNMCNYRENQDIQVDIIDSTSVSKDSPQVEQSADIKNVDIKTPSEDENVIFRVAVIAVPIAGGLILVILILMAVRMLREDYRRSDNQHRLLKAHSFIEQHFVRKDEKKHKTSKKCFSNSVRHVPTAVHSTQHRSTKAGDKQTDTEASQVRVSLLPADKQSDVSLV